MNILVTGSNGFIGKNILVWLMQIPDYQVNGIEIDSNWVEIDQALATADFIVHLAGVNRPDKEEEFRKGNVDFTAEVCKRLIEMNKPTPFILSSSIQSEYDNPYGISKRQAEQVVQEYGRQSGAPVYIYRLPNVFGKWCRPYYNSVVATFCHNIARDLPITISDSARDLHLAYIDDVVKAFIEEIGNYLTVESRQKIVPGHIKAENGGESEGENIFYRKIEPTYRIMLGPLAAMIQAFRESRRSLQLPDFSNEFTFKLYGTYLTYLTDDDFAYKLEERIDLRGCLAEFVKSPAFGQVFVSRTLPGITRGNHYHSTKAEKFLVVEGEAVIRFRHIQRGEAIEYRVSGADFRVLDIPPGYTHSIENIGSKELVTLFWSNEMFDLNRPDTYYLMVEQK